MLFHAALRSQEYSSPYDYNVNLIFPHADASAGSFQCVAIINHDAITILTLSPKHKCRSTQGPHLREDTYAGSQFEYLTITRFSKYLAR